MLMIGCLGQPRAAQELHVVARAVAAVSLAALAVVHIVDLRGTLGIAALSVETLIILLASGWGAWQTRIHTEHGPRRTSALRVLRRRAESLSDQNRPLRPVR
jgi:hypothetical protein